MIVEDLTQYAACPHHAHVVSGDGVWMEGEALAQFARVARLDGCIGAAAMPDLHPGRGIPIGAAFATRGVVYPQLIGGDAGCGARVVVTSLARVSRGRLERRIVDAFDGSPLDGCDPHALFAAVFRGGAPALATVDGVPDALRAMAACERDTLAVPSAEDDRYDADFARYLGTIGGGNHFAEISEVSDVVDAARAEALGLRRNAVVVLAHSGSRGLGDALARRWGATPLTGASIGPYLRDLAGACRFAQANRLVLVYRLLHALGATRAGDRVSTFDVTHNDVRLEALTGDAASEAFVHRKGAAPAYAEALTTILGSRGAPTWIMEGTGAARGLSSVAHGAGRRMGRSEARSKIKARYTRTQLAKSPLGGRLICDDADLLLEEHPDVYKAVEPVVAAVEAHGLARRVAALSPVFTVKL